VSGYGKNLAWGDHVVVVGLQQTGKSTLARALIRGARRVVMVDPKGDYARVFPRAQIMAPGGMEHVNGTDRYLRVVVLVGRDPDVEIADEVRYVCRKVREWSDGPGLGLVVVFDELHLYSASASSELRAVMANGHGISPAHGGVVSVFVSQRGVDLPLGCRALATRAYSFAQQHPRDLERLEDEFGAEFRETAEHWDVGQDPAYWEQRRFYRK
jgi:hypothetical protein